MSTIQQRKKELRKLANEQDYTPKEIDIIHFCQNLTIGLDRFDFQSRQFLLPILKDDSNQITVLKSRQVGFTVLQAAMMAFYSITRPGIGIMYCSYNLKHMRYISKSLLKPFIQSQMTLTKQQESIESYFLPNGSIITLISGSNAFSQAKGYKVDLLCIDEAEALQLEELPIILESMAASKINKVIMGGTGTAEGSEWENIWKSTNQMEWQNNSWQKSNDSKNNGYHITQRMLPNWTQAKEDQKRQDPRYTPLKFSTEVLGIFAPQTELPITVNLVKSIMTDDTWHKPTHNNEIVASLDLAGGGDADTIITITELSEIPKVLFSKAIQDKYSKDIMAQITPVLELYNPNVIVSDAGGNDQLLFDLREKHNVTTFRFSTTLEPIKFDEQDHKVNRTFFIQKVIQRFQEQRIQIPNAEPWLIDHLTSQIAENIQPQGRPSFIRFSKMPNRKDDFLMSLVFLECYIFSKDDPNNPANKTYTYGVSDVEYNGDF